MQRQKSVHFLITIYKKLFYNKIKTIYIFSLLFPPPLLPSLLNKSGGQSSLTHLTNTLILKKKLFCLLTFISPMILVRYKFSYACFETCLRILVRWQADGVLIQGDVSHFINFIQHLLSLKQCHSNEVADVGRNKCKS